MSLNKRTTINKVVNADINVQSYGNHTAILLGVVTAKVSAGKIEFVTPFGFAIAAGQEYLLDTIRDIIADNIEIGCEHNCWLDTGILIAPIARLLVLDLVDTNKIN